MSQEETVSKTEHLQICNALKALIQTRIKERDFNYKQWQETKQVAQKFNENLEQLTKEYKKLDEKKESYELAISDASVRIAKLTEERREIAETVSRLELQLQSHKDEHWRLSNQINTTNFEIADLKRKNEQLSKDNRTLTTISLDSLISINQLISKEQ